MVDRYGRSIQYLRISVTDRCNLRCVYCMPEHNITWAAPEELLTGEEILRVIRVLAKHGIKKIRFTGGEPLLREDLTEIIRAAKQIHGIQTVMLTTNGVLLAERLPALIEAGLDGINLSLDTLDRAQYADITRHDMLPQVLQGLEAALRAPSLKVKVNCVLTKEHNNDAVSLAEMAKEQDLSIRFIELMPVGQGKNYHFCAEDEVLERLENKFGKAIPLASTCGSGGPARYITFPQFRGRVGFISAMTRPFCAGCNRIRLTATGELKPCLQYESGLNLKQMMNASTDDLNLEYRLYMAVYKKPIHHHFGDGAYCGDEQRQMNQIGG